MVAGYIWFFAGWIVVAIGIVLLIASRTTDSAGYYLIYAGIVLEIPAIIRCAQCAREGRRFRAEHPKLD
jgi:uncharacterized membrane protein